MTVAGYTLTYRGIARTPTARTRSRRARSSTSAAAGSGTLLSGDNDYLNPPEPSREVGIKTNWLRGEDLYVIADDVNAKTNVVYFKVLVKPLVNLIWIAGIVFLLGSVVALWPDAREQRRLVAAARARAGMTALVAGRR